MLRAIIVEDEELSVKRLKRIVSDSGEIGVCDTFLNPLEAYEYVKTNPIDIAFLDISMPEINGMRLSSRLLDLDDSIDVVEIRIDESAIYCDLYEFKRLLKQIRLSPENSDGLFQQAVALYAGPFLKGKTYEWAGERTRRLERDYIELLDLAARFHLERKQLQQALHYFSEILKLDAFREDISYEVIRLYSELGRTAEALKQYLLEELLQRELGMKPSR